MKTLLLFLCSALSAFSAITSTFTADTPQKDGRQFVVERHIDDFGIVHRFEYLRDSGTNPTNVMSARATALVGWLKEWEIERILSRELTSLPQYATGAELLSGLRERYKAGRGDECARLARFLLNAIDAGRITDLQARNAFGMSAGAWTTLKAKLENLRTSLNATQNAQGE